MPAEKEANSSSSSPLQDQLFLACGASADRITHFSCGHVIPPENLLPVVMTAGPTGLKFDFTFASRDDICKLV